MLPVSEALESRAFADAGSRREQRYDLESDDWDGMSRFAELASEMRITFDTPENVDVSSLGPNDSLFVLGPVDSFPATVITEFLRRGGRMAVVDDSGASAAFLSLFSVETVALEDRVDAINANPALAIAEPKVAHELTEGIARLAANHPAAFRHSSLVPLFTFYGSDGLVISGAIAAGRLVAVSDPGVFINNMMELADNRRFASNFLMYLNSREVDGERVPASGRIFLVTPETRLVGVGGTNLSTAIERLREEPQSESTTRLLSLATLMLGAFLLAVWLRGRGRSVSALPSGGGGVGRWRTGKGTSVARFAIASLRVDLEQFLSTPFLPEEDRNLVVQLLQELNELESGPSRQLEAGLANLVEKLHALEASSAPPG